MSDESSSIAIVSPDDTETLDERELFNDAVEAVRKLPEIADLLGEYYAPEEVTNYIDQHRIEIWHLVADQRDRVRVARAQQEQLEANLLSKAEAAARQSQPDTFAKRAELDRQLDEIEPKKAALQAQVDRQKAKIEARRNSELVQGVEEQIRQAEAAFDEPNGSVSSQRSLGRTVGSQRRLRFLRLSPRKGRVDDGTSAKEANSLKAAEFEYQQLLERLTQVRRAAADIETSRNRLDLILSPEIERAKRAIRIQVDWQTVDAEMTAAQETLKKSLHKAILREIRRFINKRASRIWDLQMRVREAEGIYEPLSQPDPIETPAILQLSEMLDRMTGASIGLAGPRGSGKTTLIRYFCTRQKGILLSAPIEYNPIDFILHLYAELCRSIAGGPDADDRITRPPVQPEQRPDNDQLVSRRWLGSVAVAFAIVASSTLAVIAVSAHMSFTRPAAILVALGGIATAIVAAMAMVDISPARNRLLAVATAGLLLGTTMAEIGPSLSSGLIGLIVWCCGMVLFVVFGYLLATIESRVAPHISPPRIPGVPRGIWITSVLVFSSVSCALVGSGFALASSRFVPTNVLLFFSGCVALITAGAVLFSLGNLVIEDADPLGVHSPLESGKAYPSPHSDGTAYPSGVIPGSTHEAHQQPSPIRRNIIRMSYFLAGVLAAGGLGAAIVSYFRVSLRIYHSSFSIYALCAGGLLLLCAVTLWLNLQSAHERPPEANGYAGDDDDYLTRLALKHLADIRIQQTFNADITRNWTLAAPNFPLSFESQRSWGTSWSLSPRTLPEIVDRFRKFAAEVSQRQSLLIAIDELDKLQGDKAEEFVNSIKAVFGVQGCRFLVSVSEDAAASFERRGVPFRDVFDSSFNDVIIVNYARHDTAAAILQGRIVGLSQPFISLCHVLAGGLPRDLIRVARTLLGPEYCNKETLAESARRLCADELVGKTRGVRRALLKMQDDEIGSELLEYILAYDRQTGTAVSLYRQSERLRAWIVRTTSAGNDGKGAAGGVVQCVRELSTFAYFAATTCQFFDEGLTSEKLDIALASGDDWRSIEHLVSARQAMAVSALDAERRVTEFRQAWRLPIPNEVRGWTKARYQRFLKRLREDGAAGQADAIEAAVAKGGFIDRASVRHAVSHQADRTFEGFFQPVDRVMNEFRAASLAHADAPCPIARVYITTQRGSRLTSGFRVLPDLVEVFTAE